MRIVSVWREWESGDSLPLAVLRIAVLLCGLLFLGFTAVLGLPWPQQALVALLTVVVAMWLDRSSGSYAVTLTLMLLSLYSTFRYGFWRVVTTTTTVRSAGTRWDAIDAVFILLLLGAECYAFAVLVLGYMQMVWPLRRTPVPLPDNTADWPAVDVLIPTLNEPLEVVRFTVLAALNMDWPAEKLRVYLLDDGRRDEFREFARQAGAGYLTREDNQWAKAGNLNAALERVSSPFVVVFDADHVPTRSFLQVTMGWFLRDAQLGIMQTPHHFYSPDPFERNLGQFRTIPNEDELFYGVVQDGNDFWNATYFCGSCAVLRRSALDGAGGMATDTVTEDAHTSMRMQRLGWNSAYINIPQAAGLATERLSAHVRQRIRWARGMMQILRIENPMFGPGLTLAQRLCYLNAMSHFLYALPRLIFLTAPLMYLIFGYTNIPGYWAAILAYAGPHLVLSRIARSRMQGRHRHSFWTEIYETVLAPYLVLPTLGALLRPKGGRFNVTPKGETVHADFFDSHIARPTLVLLACNWFGLCCAMPRFLQFPSWQVPVWARFVNWPATLYDPGHAGTIALNAGWTIFNLVLLGVALGVAWESQQRRRSVRVETQVPSEVMLQDGSIVRGVTADLSSGGVRTTMEYDVTAAPGDRVQFIFPVPDGTAALPGTVVSLQGRTLRARFDDLTLEQYETLTMILYSRADRWLGWGEAMQPDRPMRSFFRVLRLALRGLRQAFFGPSWNDDASPRGTWATSVVPLIALVALMGLGERTAAGARQGAKAPVDALEALANAHAASRAPAAKPVAAAAVFHSSFTLAEAGTRETIALRGAASRRNVTFGVAQGALVESAVLRLRYRLSPHLLPGVSGLKVMLNGREVATIHVTAPAEPVNAGDDRTGRQSLRPGDALGTVHLREEAGVQESVITLPAELLGRLNELGFELTGHYTQSCEDPTDPALWGHVDTDSTIELQGTTIPLQDDLALLPAPFFQPAQAGSHTVQIAFAETPSLEAIRAAGVLASWIGVMADGLPVKFVTSVGRIPAGDAIVLAEGRAGLPPNVTAGLGQTGALAAMRTNPTDPNGKLLVLTANSGTELGRVAAAIASSRGAMHGAQVEVPAANGVAVRSATPVRWLSTSETKTFADAETTDLDGDGSQTASVYVRLPPDLYLGTGGYLGAGGLVGPKSEGSGDERTVPLHLRYRYDGAAVSDGSELEVWVNGAFVRSVPLHHVDGKPVVDEAVVPIPASSLRPFSNTLSLRFAFEPAKRGGCATGIGGGFRGNILKDSFLDLRGIPRWTELPNLGIFAAAGYPFTREADLGATAVILPEQPTADEMGLFFAVMEHFGAQTGIVATAFTVTGPDGLERTRGKDVVVLGSVADQPMLRGGSVDLPASVDEGGLHLRGEQGLFNSSRAWWKVRGRDAGEGLASADTGMPDALVEELEWPRRSNHIMVVMAVRDDSAAAGLVPAFAASSQSGAIGGDLAIVRGGTFRSFRTGGRVFMTGHLPILQRAGMEIEQFPWVIPAASVMFCFLMASLLRTALRRSARVRLQGNY